MAKRKVVEEDLISDDDRSGSEQSEEATPSPVKRQRVADEERINKINELSPDDFKKRYIPAESLNYSSRSTQDAKQFTINFKSPNTIAKIEIDACFKLIESTSRPDYASSSWGWHPKSKKREMREDEMRYLLVRSTGDNEDPVLGFLSFMLLHDSTPSVPVLYVYEIHLSRALRGLGLGAHLMELAETIAASVTVEKTMLTCFVGNTTARSFYEKRGYVPDACSPEDRRTRNKVVKPDYVIMSKAVPGSSVEAAVTGGDVREGLQMRVERTATDSSAIEITERRPALKHNVMTNSAGRDDAVEGASRKGWKSVFSGMFASGEKENVR